MPTITPERTERNFYSPDDISLSQWVDINRPNVLHAHETLPEDSLAAPTTEDDLARATQMLSTDRDSLMVNILYGLSQREDLPAEINDYIQSSLDGYTLCRSTQHSPNMDYRSKLNIYGITVGQLVQKSLESFDEHSMEENSDQEKLVRQLGTAVWTMTNEVTIRQKAYRALLGPDRQIDTKLQQSAFHDPSTLLEIGQPELERITEHNGKPAQWLANWTDALTVQQVNSEKNMLDKALFASLTDEKEHKKTRFWPQLIGFLALARA